MRSWFCLIAVICMAVGLGLMAWAWNGKSPAWVASGYLAIWLLAAVAGIVSLVRREPWRATSSFVLGLSVASAFWMYALVSAVADALAQAFSHGLH